MSDEIAESVEGAQPVVDVAPLMVGGLSDGDGAGSMFAFHPENFAGNDGQRLLPRDPDVAGDAALPGIARSFRVEIDAFHGI